MRIYASIVEWTQGGAANQEILFEIPVGGFTTPF